MSITFMVWLIIAQSIGLAFVFTPTSVYRTLFRRKKKDLPTGWWEGGEE